MVAAREFKLTLLKASHPGHDARDADGRFVQIKMVGAKARGVALYANCDRLIVLQIASPQEARVLYDGLGEPAWAAAQPFRKNGQRVVALSRLVKIAESGISPVA